MDDTLIKVEGVSKKFCRSLKSSLWYGMQDLSSELLGRRHGGNGELRPDEFWAVKDVSFELKRGECMGLIGSNGAGKTTLLKMLNGLIKPDAGRIEMRGRVGALIALGAGFNPILTGRENIYVNASVLGLNKREIDGKIDEIIEFAEISDFIDSPVQHYSSGMQVRLGFSISTALEPDILLLDEILAVGDAAFRTKCFNRIESLISKCAVVFVSHSMAQVTRVCDNLLLMQRGTQMMYGSNIGDIIYEYNNSKNIKVERAAVEGSQNGKIDSVKIFDNQGIVSNLLEYGESWGICATISIADNTIPTELKLLITINDQEEINVAQLEKSVCLTTLNSKVKIRMTYDQCLFNAGKYYITANLQIGKRGEQAHVIRNAIELIVKRGITGYAPIILIPSKVEVNLCH